MDKEKTNNLTPSTDDLLPVSQEFIDSLPAGIHYIKDPEGKLLIDKQLLQMMKSRETTPKKELFYFEDLNSGFKVMLESEQETMQDLIIKGEVVKNKFVKNHRAPTPLTR